MKSLDLCNEKDELKQIEGIFLQKLMNNLIPAEKDDLNYESKRGKTYNFGKYSLPNVFKRYV